MKLLKWRKLPINYHLKEFFKIDFSITICVSHFSHNINIPLCTLIYLALIHFILCTRLTACTLSLSLIGVLKLSPNFCSFSNFVSTLKVAFRKCNSFFKSPNLQKKFFQITIYLELEIWICCLLLLAENLNFKFRIVIWNIFFGDLEIWKTNHTF